MSLKLLIIADDLTGALDSAAQTANTGVPCALVFGGELPAGAAAAVINTESRHITPDKAADAVLKAAGYAGDALVYKKIDSTLRGNIGAELAALMRCFGRDAVVAPAFPKTGRTTSGGVQLLSGVPVHETEFGRDALNPVSCSDIIRLLTSGGVSEAVLVSRGEKPVPLPFCGGGRAYVFDASDEEGLVYATACAGMTDPLPILCGSAGLAAHIAPLCGFSPSEMPEIKKTERLVCISGSLKDSSARQLVYAAARGWDVIYPSREELLSLRLSGANAVIASGSCRLAISAAHADMSGVGYDEICAALASVSAPYAQEAGGLVIFGGDTASAVFRGLAAESLTVVGEEEPGVPLSLLSAGGREYSLATKAGGFGGDDLLIRLERVMGL